MNSFKVKTKGHADFIDITGEVMGIVENSSSENGVAHLFVPGSTAALTTIEYESGVIEDMTDVLEKIAPENADYKHHLRWGDRNGAAHIRAAMIGPDLSIPFENKRLALGTWQQIVLIDFDERPRSRQIFVQIISSILA